MPLKERISSFKYMKQWSDKIPLTYEYTHGVAGEIFINGLIDGKIMAARCNVCNLTFLPPKIYCTSCFHKIEDYVDVGNKGKISALAECNIDFYGNKVNEPYMIAFITFNGVKGGLMHRVKGDGLRIGSKVIAKFRERKERVGSINDIEYFAKA